MEKYKVTVLLTHHENKECLKDTIDNIFKFNDNVCIVIADGSNDDLSDLEKNNVLTYKRKVNFKLYDTLVPVHIEMSEFMLEKNIVSEYVLMMSSNQLFIRRGLYDFISTFGYESSYYGREIDAGCIPHLMRNEVYRKYREDLGDDNFKHQSNHDGTFFTYKIFMDMMQYFHNYKGQMHDFHGEEFLYPAFLFKGGYKLAEFGLYNFWEPNWRRTPGIVTKQNVDECLSKGIFLVKRIPRQIDNETRTYIRQLKAD